MIGALMCDSLRVPVGGLTEKENAQPGCGCVGEKE